MNTREITDNESVLARDLVYISIASKEWELFKLAKKILYAWWKNEKLPEECMNTLLIEAQKIGLTNQPERKEKL
jgi:hypothetical protein